MYTPTAPATRPTYQLPSYAALSDRGQHLASQDFGRAEEDLIYLDSIYYAIKWVKGTPIVRISHEDYTTV